MFPRTHGHWPNATPVGGEPRRGNPIGLAGRRLSRSAKVSSVCTWVPGSQRGYLMGAPAWADMIGARGARASHVTDRHDDDATTREPPAMYLLRL